MKTCCICPGTAPCPCRPPHASSLVTGTSWLFCLPSATHVLSLGLDSLVTSSQNHLQIDKIHFVECKILTCKCAGPPDVIFFSQVKRLIFKCYLKLKVDDERTRMRSAVARTEGRLKQIQNQYLHYFAAGFIVPHQFLMLLVAQAEDTRLLQTRTLLDHGLRRSVRTLSNVACWQ